MLTDAAVITRPPRGAAVATTRGAAVVTLGAALVTTRGGVEEISRGAALGTTRGAAVETTRGAAVVTTRAPRGVAVAGGRVLLGKFANTGWSRDSATALAEAACFCWYFLRSSR